MSPIGIIAEAAFGGMRFFVSDGRLYLSPARRVRAHKALLAAARENKEALVALVVQPAIASAFSDAALPTPETHATVAEFVAWRIDPTARAVITGLKLVTAFYPWCHAGGHSLPTLRQLYTAMDDHAAPKHLQWVRMWSGAIVGDTACASTAP